MILGRITVRIENQGGSRYFFARPVEASGIPHPGVPGVPQVVYLEKNDENRSLKRDDIVEVFGIFNRIHTEEEWREGFVRVYVSPIPESVYQELLALYPQKSHIFH